MVLMAQHFKAVHLLPLLLTVKLGLQAIAQLA
jgi:hypothetical protein